MPFFSSDPLKDLPDIHEFDFDNPEKTYVIVPKDKIPYYEARQFKPVGQAQTAHDGTMYLMEKDQ